MTYLLSLSDGVDSVSFIGDSTYFYIDGSFDAPTPSPTIKLSEPTSTSLSSVTSKVYTTRDISFEFLVRASQQQDALLAVSKVQKMLERESMSHIQSGSFYAKGSTAATGNEPGDTGLILKVQLKETVNDDVLTFRVIYGTVSYANILSETGIKAKDSDGKTVLYGVEVNLTCDPYGLGPEELLSDEVEVTLPGAPIAGDTSSPYLSVGGSSVKGDAPALILVSAERGISDGLIVARESGSSVLNGAGFPYFDGTGVNDMFTMGVPAGAANEGCFVFEISSTGTPDSFRTSYDGGSTWAESSPGVDRTWTITGGIQDINGMKIRFMSTTGHTVSDAWYVNGTQRVIYPLNKSATQYAATPTETYTPSTSADIGGPEGGIIASFHVNIPWATSGKYLVVSQHTDNAGEDKTEFAFTTENYNPFYNRYSDGNSNKRWARSVEDEHVILGLLDLSASSRPMSQHPNVTETIRVNIWARRLDPSDLSTISIGGFVLIPCEGEGAWGIFSSFIPYQPGVGSGRWLLSNYNQRFPYIGFMNVVDTADGEEGEFAIEFGGQVVGSIPTLIPGVSQTLTVIRGLAGFTADTDYRRLSLMSSEFDVTLRCRPRYLVVA